MTAWKNIILEKFDKCEQEQSAIDRDRHVSAWFAIGSILGPGESDAEAHACARAIDDLEREGVLQYTPFKPLARFSAAQMGGFRLIRRQPRRAA